jgi:Mg-chelatase subunit ChlD
MRFEHAWWLLASVPALGLAWLVARWGARAVSRRQHRMAMWMRMAALTLLVVAAAQPILTRQVDDRSVLFLLDRSASISAGASEEQESFLATAISEGQANARTAVAVFGRDIRLDSAFTTGRIPGPIRSVPDDSATDLIGALEAAAALIPTEGSRRIVLITDLVPTTGDARPAARRLAAQGVAVDVVELESARAADALIESIIMPAAVRRGDQVPITAVVRTNQAGTADLIVTSGGEEQVLPVVLQSGRNEVPIELVAARAGFLPVAVEVRAGFDTRNENNRAEAITRVLGPARVAVVEGVEGEADEMARALQAGGIEVDTRRSVPGKEELLGYDAVVMVNVKEPGVADSENLVAFVEDLGRGLVVVGGDRAYGLGGYHQTALEPVLPVSSNPDDLVRRQPVAEVLVIDSSGSMGACHCNMGNAVDGGVVKTDIARAGAELAIDALANDDRVGVLAFSSGTEWVIPLAPRSTITDAAAALGTITPSGDTEISRALEVALEEVDDAPEDLRHIVLFTDGWDPSDSDLLPMARRIADRGVTLSVLGTGEGPGTVLQRMAELGGGRYYPGADLASIPEIFVEETLTVARNLANEGSFYPVLGSPSPITEDLKSSPPLLGYVLTKAKGTASVVMEVGQGDPLLATWQRGLGRATAWTSDATARWSSQWVDWEGFVEFWGAVVRDVLPAGRDNPPATFVSEGALRITFDLAGAEIDATATARVRGPSGEVYIVPMNRVSGDRFAASVPLADAGAYWVSVTVDNGDGSRITSSSGAVSAYEEEFAFREPDGTLGTDIAALTGGRLDPDPRQVFDPAPVRGRAEVSIWPWLVAIALALFLIDVAMRRLVVSAGDSEIWKEGLTSARTRERRRIEQELEKAAASGAPPPVLSKSETLERLMRRKRR